MELNPYAKFLGDQDARAVIAATPGLVHQAVSAMTAEQALARAEAIIRWKLGE